MGRLDLTIEEGLANYIDALIDDWNVPDMANPAKPVVWSTNWGLPDITFLMAHVIGAKLDAKFSLDEELRERTWLTGTGATYEALVAALLDKRPGLICTTSHGKTGPLNDRAATIANLGSPVDNARRCLEVSALDAWSPGGAIWYSHACCSAGSDVVTRYSGLIAPTQRGGALLRGVAEVAGARVAPLPRKLLGRSNPLRAFVGLVSLPSTGHCAIPPRSRYSRTP